MNKEFHYWATGIIAEYAGFPAADCRTIAYSSQYTDDNNNPVEVFADEFDVTPSYVSHVSQTEDITQPQKEIMKIYPLFHFIPGDRSAAAARNDGKTHPLLTTPDSSYARKIMEYTLQNALSRYSARDKSCLYRIGIAAHCYVDTWAHQNFIGWYDHMNGLEGVKLPDIGHFDLLQAPDLVNHTWQDTRLQSPTINNNDRFISAAQRLYEYFSSFCQQLPGTTPRGNVDQLLQFLHGVWSNDSLDEHGRIKQYKDHSGALKNYDDCAWGMGAFTLQTVLDPEREGSMLQKCVWRKDVKSSNTDWYKFQEAVKCHIADAATIVRPAFLEAQVDI